MFSAHEDVSSTNLDCRGNQKKFEELIVNGNLENELTRAMSYAQSTVATVPQGKVATRREASDVKSTGDAGCLFSGTLSMLDLSRNALEGFDTSRIAFTLGTYPSIPELMKGIGPVTINIDAWVEEGFANLQRFDKDAEVHTLCLLLFWASGTSQEANLLTACADLVFDGQRKGLGSRLSSAKVVHLENEEKKRHVLASSAWPKCMLICDAARLMHAEGRFLHIKGEDNRLEKMFQEDKVPMAKLNSLTLKRYLALGRRITPAVSSLLMKWELFEKRGSLVDTITALRAVFGATNSEEDCNLHIHCFFP